MVSSLLRVELISPQLSHVLIMCMAACPHVCFDGGV